MTRKPPVRIECPKHGVGYTYSGDCRLCERELKIAQFERHGIVAIPVRDVQTLHDVLSEVFGDG